MLLENKTALITGAGEGIGKSIALRFAEEGANIIVADINLNNARKVAREIISSGRKALSVKVDVSKRKDVERMVKKVINEFTRIDILVNNAGISEILPFNETSEKTWDRIIDVNLKGTFLCCKAVIPHMQKQRSGKIVNMSSQSGKKGNRWYAAYCASKFGIIGLTQSIALEFAPYGININALCPNVVFTSMWNKQLKQYARKYGIPSKKVKGLLLGKIPLGRFPLLKEISDVALFLVTEASNYITGQAINVTGGQDLT